MTSHHSSIPRAPRPASVTYAATVGIIAGLAAATLALLGYLAGGIGGWQLFGFALPSHSSAATSFFDPRIVVLGSVLVAAGLMLLWCQAYLDRKAIHTHLST
jgi:hypothetical protein